MTDRKQPHKASWFLIAGILWSAAFALHNVNTQAQTVIEKRPVTACEADNMRLLKIIVDLRAEPDIQFVAVPVAAKPIIQTAPLAKHKARIAKLHKSTPRACPILKGRQKCKRGRWQSPKYKCKCGKW